MSSPSRPRTRPSSASVARPRSTACRFRRSATRVRVNTRQRGAEAERRARLHYRLRASRILDANTWAGGNELDLVVRRGRSLVFCEVKQKSGPDFGDPEEMVTEETQRRLRRAA